MKSILNIAVIVIILSILFSCSFQSASVTSQLFPNKPDTTNLPELAIFLEPDQLQAIIKEKTFLSNGNKRYKGIIAIPQNGDDFRLDSLDEVYWPKSSVIEGDFRGASIRSGRCIDGNYRKSDFRAADVRWTIFDGSIMDSINFQQSRLFHVKVNYVILSNSNFRGANMFGMEGHFATMRNCDFSGALMKDSEFLESDLTGSVAIKAKLFRAVLLKSKLDSCDFSYADFTGAGLEESSFINSRLWYANFQGGHLQGTDLRGADLKGCNFFGTEFENTNFKGAINIPKEIEGFIDENGLATGVWQDTK
ncbi:MAG: pentapeptide repeat-containing protein [Flavobacteriaceae bacterium]|nr:pentapeptide repeat-containing protein [Flavobacteriaceae bacterium]